MLFSTGPTQKARWVICNTCDQQVKMTILVCKACGCHLPSKISLGGAACPLGKWTSETLKAPEQE